MARGARYEERVEHFTLDLEKQISVFVMKVFSAKCVNFFYYKCTWGMVIQYWGGVGEPEQLERSHVFLVCLNMRGYIKF